MQLMSYKQALRQALDEELNNDENVFLIGEDIGVYGGSNDVEEGLLEKYGPERVLSTPPSESTILGSAVGAAMTGMRPVVEMNSADFVAYGIDAIVNQAAKASYYSKGDLSVPLVVRVPSGGTQALGGVQNFESVFAGVPGLKVVAPSTPAQAKGLLKAAINDPNPVVFIENIDLYDNTGIVPEESDFIIDLESTVIEKEGTDVTIVAWGAALEKVFEVVSTLEREGISAEIINPLTLYPMDMKPIYDSVMKTTRLVIVHDSPKTGGVGAEIAAKVAESESFDYLDAPIIRVAGADAPVPFNQTLQQIYTPEEEEIFKAVYTVTGVD